MEGSANYAYMNDMYSDMAPSGSHPTAQNRQQHPYHLQQSPFHYASDSFNHSSSSSSAFVGSSQSLHYQPDPLLQYQSSPFSGSQIHSMASHAYSPPPGQNMAHVSQGSQQGSMDPQIHLELLRETRRIRELELSIASEKRRSDEAIMRQRQAELAIANLGHHTHDFSSVDDTGSTSSFQPDASLAESWPFASFPSFDDHRGGTYGSSNQDISSLEASPDPAPVSASFPDAGLQSGHHYDLNSSPALGPSTSSNDQYRSPPVPARSSKKKKGVVLEERELKCMKCSKVVVKALLRGTRNELDVQSRAQFRCNDCMEPEGQMGATLTSKKRTNEIEDTTAPTICIVCTRVQGQGGFVSKDRQPLAFTYDAVCVPCSQKYKRCSNCGGASSRAMIGKWRCKEMFEEGRKTCSLSHDKLGARDMEMSVWEIPGNVSHKKEYPDMVRACVNLWKEHQLGKNATPEVLEHSVELRTYDDIMRKIINMGPPANELLTKPPLTPYHRQYLSLTWAKARRRRDKSKPEWTRSTAAEKSTAEWVAFNTRKSEVLMPANSVLAGVWFFEWHIKNRTLLTGTLTMFDRGDVDERGVFSHTSILLRTFQEIDKHNSEFPDDPWLPPEHLWVATKSAPSNLSHRLYELMERRAGMLNLDEYISRNPRVDPSIFSPETSRIATHLTQRIPGDPAISVFVKHLGDRIKVEGVENVMKRELAKIPKNVEV